MRSRTTKSFRKQLAALPRHVQEQAEEAYQRWQEDPSYNSLRFKQVHPSKPVYSVRISRDYRALGLLKGDTVYWYWIGNHADYDKLL